MDVCRVLRRFAAGRAPRQSAGEIEFYEFCFQGRPALALSQGLPFSTLCFAQRLAGETLP
jgi:hypothetical protein